MKTKDKDIKTGCLIKNDEKRLNKHTPPMIHLQKLYHIDEKQGMVHNLLFGEPNAFSPCKIKK